MLSLSPRMPGLLSINVGNTQVKFGLHVEGQLVGLWRTATDRRRTPDEWVVLLLGFLAQGRMGPEGVQGAIIASVVPAVTTALSNMLRHSMRLEPLIVGPGIALGIEVALPDPGAVGADRVVNVLAARERYRAPCVVIDLGTATNFDVVSPAGAFIGGVIAPGVHLAAEAQVRPAQLAPVAPVFPPGVIGRQAASAMQSGLMWGYLGLIDGLARRILAELGQPARVIGTGGLATLFAPHSETIETVDQDLTMRGLYQMWLLNQ
jgi:type III pantothenate kinase